MSGLPLSRSDDAAILEALVADVRRALSEEGVPERIRRRGWGTYSVTLKVQDWQLKGTNVGIDVHHRHFEATNGVE